MLTPLRLQKWLRNQPRTGRNGCRFLASATLLMIASFGYAQAPEPGGTAESAQMTVQNPDEYAWRLFLFINRQAKLGIAGVADPDKPTVKDYDENKDVVWETWALASRDGHSE